MKPIAKFLVCLAMALALPAIAPTHTPEAAPSGLTLSFPVACTPHKTCFVQSYVDVDEGAGTKDYRCGGATYDGHKGTDIRLLSARHALAGIKVLAAAPGTVARGRDGMPDRLLRDGDKVPSERECGNGVVIDHGGGWETQYCHLRRGSLRVTRGQDIARGEPIGDVGYSGKTQFAHLHLTVRKDGKVIDPFTGTAPDGTCRQSAGTGLWDGPAKAGLAYRESELIEVAASGSIPPAEHEQMGLAPTPPEAQSANLVVVARFINLRKGDQLRLTLTGPSGLHVESKRKPLRRNRATQVAYTGRKLRGPRWPGGRYEGNVELLRAGKVVIGQVLEFEID